MAEERELRPLDDCMRSQREGEGGREEGREGGREEGREGGREGGGAFTKEMSSY